MANEYDKLIEQAIANCEFLTDGQTREECCLEKGITECPPLEIKPQSRPEGITPVVVLLVSAVVISALVYLAVKKSWFPKLWGKFSETTKATISGWAIWIFLVFSYIAVMEPYGYGIAEEELFNLIQWFILPPLAVLAIYLWVRRFIKQSR